MQIKAVSSRLVEFVGTFLHSRYVTMTSRDARTYTHANAKVLATFATQLWQANPTGTPCHDQVLTLLASA